MLHHLGAPRILIKLDLARAFDSLSWPFLTEVLRRLGMSDKFLGWVAILFTSASNKVLLNGEPGPPIWHQRGLRQGDPLSPQLFVIGVDVLGKLIYRAVELGLLQQLYPRRTIPPISLSTPRLATLKQSEKFYKSSDRPLGFKLTSSKARPR